MKNAILQMVPNSLGRRIGLTLSLLFALAAGAATQPYDEALEYIESDGSQYMDTGLVLSNDVTVTLSFAATKSYVNTGKVFGGRDSATSRSISCFFTSNGFYVDFNDSVALDYRASTPVQNDPFCRWDVEISALRRIASARSNLILPKKNEEFCPDEFSTSATARIFDLSGTDAGMAAASKVSARLYSLTITNATGVLRDYQPCRKNGVVGLYDRATKEFLAPAAGVLAAGPTVDTPACDVTYSDDEAIIRISPVAYPVEYIESDGIAYLDTGIVLSNTMSVAFDYAILANTSPSGAAIGVFGSRLSAAERNIAISFASGSSNTAVDFGSNNGYRIEPKFQLGVGYHTYLGADERCTINLETGVVIARNQKVWSSDNPFTTPSSALVFGAYNGQQTWEKMKGRVYSLVIKDGDEVIRDYEPYVTNGVACLRDKVTGTNFLFNANTSGGVLTAGPKTRTFDFGERISGLSTNAVGEVEVERLGSGASSCDVLSVITPAMAHAVEYLESDGSQYFDTGFVITKDMAVTLEFAITDYGNGPAGVFGSRQDADHRTAAISYASDKQISCDFGGAANHRANAIKITCGPEVKFTAVLNAKVRSLKGGSVDVKSTADASGEDDWQTPGNAWILGTQNTTWNKAKARLYSVRITCGGAAFRDYQPCVRDGVPCLFDRVTRTYLFEASGKNDFGVGPRIEQPVCYSLDGFRNGPVVPVTNLVASVAEPTTMVFSIPVLQPGTSYEGFFLAENHVTSVPTRMPVPEVVFYSFATEAENASLKVDYALTGRSRLALSVLRTGCGATKLHAVYGSVCGGDAVASWEHNETIADLGADETTVSALSPRFDGTANYLRLYTEDGEWSQTICLPATGLVQKPAGGLMLIFR